LDEDEIDMDDEEGGNFMDASEMLDASDYDSESEEEDDEEHGQDEEQMRSESEEESEVDSEYEGALDKLSSFVDGLEGSKKRKAGDELDDVDDGGKKKKRVVLKERTEAWPEGEFVAVTAADGVADCELLAHQLRSFDMH
jgi:U3 small nucleolar RNA-associated protein 14